MTSHGTNHSKPNPPECVTCGAEYTERRAALGYNTCLECGEFAAHEVRATWTIVCTPKGHYTRITRPDELKGLNQKPK